jgi:carbamoyltransferase
MIQIGISCYYHDSSVCLLKDGKVLLAVEEERFSGIKHDSSFPEKSIKWIIEESGFSFEEIEEVCFYEKPLVKTHRVVTTCLKNFQIKDAFKFAFKGVIQFIELKKKLKWMFSKAEIKFTSHHDSHIGYSFLTSSYREAAILSIDGVGEWDTTVLAHGEGNNWKILETTKFPNSLGMLYSTFTAFLGFKPNEGEYKVMGLAPYGNPKTFSHKFREIIYPSKKGGYVLNMEMFDYHKSDEVMFTSKLSEHLGILPRLPEEEITQEHKDLAATVQFIYEMYFFRLLKDLHRRTKSDNLVLGGGCAYNGTANGKISKKTGFKNVWIPSAPSDAGSTIGACLISYCDNGNSVALVYRGDNTNPYLGPKYSTDVIKKELQNYNKKLIYNKLADDEIISVVANAISNGKVVAWFEGRLEFGARALGHRSILADPTNGEMKTRINKIVKKREGFRPFAPIVKLEDVSKYFEWDKSVPYMNQIVGVKREFRDMLPAITHVDGTARIQTLDREQCVRIYDLLTELEKQNEYPIVLNTSFNIKDQTMIRDPKTAIDTFLDIGLDMLVLEDYVITKK